MIYCFFGKPRNIYKCFSALQSITSVEKVYFHFWKPTEVSVYSGSRFDLNSEEIYTENELVALYKPIDYSFEEQILFTDEEFSNLFYVHPIIKTPRVVSMLTSMQRVVSLVKETEESITLLRSDIIFSKPFPEDVENSLLFPTYHGDVKSPSLKGNPTYLDLIQCSNLEILTKYTNIVDSLKELNNCNVPEFLLGDWISQCNLPVKEWDIGLVKIERN